jgi:hypothetical protein
VKSKTGVWQHCLSVAHARKVQIKGSKDQYYSSPFDLFQNSALITIVVTVVSRHLSLPNPMKRCWAWNYKGCVAARIVAKMPMSHRQKMSAQTFMQNGSSKMGGAPLPCSPSNQIKIK